MSVNLTLPIKISYGKWDSAEKFVCSSLLESKHNIPVFNGVCPWVCE